MNDEEIEPEATIKKCLIVQITNAKQAEMDYIDDLKNTASLLQRERSHKER